MTRSECSVPKESRIYHLSGSVFRPFIGATVTILEPREEEVTLLLVWFLTSCPCRTPSASAARCGHQKHTYSCVLLNLAGDGFSFQSPPSTCQSLLIFFLYLKSYLEWSLKFLFKDLKR